MGVNIYETAKLDINIKYENDIIEVEFTVLNADSSAYDFSNKTGSNLNIYNHISGELLKTINEHATSGLSYASNVITWNDPWGDINLALGSYYYEITYEDSGTSNPTVKIIDGTLKIE